MIIRPEHPDSRKLLEYLQSASANRGYLNYCDYINTVLYHPDWGYYQRDRRRVGRHSESDFYTSQSLGKVFAELVMEAAQTLLAERLQGSDAAPDDFTFVEIGYEAGNNWLNKTAHPFAEIDLYGLNNPLNLSGQCVVFSNELFDAQPFYRIVFLDGAWRELGVSVSDDGLNEVILENLSPAVAAIRHRFPLEAIEGYHLDLPLPSLDLLHQITKRSWSGLFLALDYGKFWEELMYDLPQGSGRAYFKHRQSSDLLANPGRRDITCHICWTWLIERLQTAGFKPVHLENQEQFFINHAGKTIERIITTRPGEFERDRQTLKHLIHPSSMGRQFQVLWGYRSES